MSFSRFFLMVLFPVLVVVFPAQAFACEEVAAWLALEANPLPAHGPLAVRAALVQERADALRAAAERLFLQYKREGWRKNFESQCVPSLLQTRFRTILTRTFLELGMRDIERSAGPAGQAFVQAWRDAEARGLAIPFLLLTEETSLPGAFHRGRKGVFMNLVQTPPANWHVILVHEMAHALDDRMAEASEIFSDPERVREVARLARESVSVDGLAPEGREAVLGWLRAGYDRGLLAEVRAWSTTVQVYRDGRRSGGVSRLDWMETILENLDPALELPQALFRYLAPRFRDPDEGIFSLPLVRNGMAILREEMAGES